MTHNSVAVWDITLKSGGSHEKDAIIETLRDIAKKWCFQLEKGEESDYLHWQIRISLFKKKRLSELKTLLDNKEWAGYHLSPTSRGGMDSLYCMKLDTRVQGPWCDKDPEPKYVQKRFRDPVMRPWQAKLEKELLAMLNEGGDRHILMVEDEGNQGKSWFKGYMMMTRDDVVILPSTLEKPNEMMEYLCSLKEIEQGWTGIIMMDVPRATSPKHWFALAAGLETIRQGFLHDKRYRTANKIIEPPQICCFMNAKPPKNCMTSDVFVYFTK